MTREALQIIDTLPQFDRLVQPLDKKEKDDLIGRIIDNPEERVIKTWRGNHLLDREKYEICNELELSVTISEQFFEDWIDGAIFICEQQLQGKELRGKYRHYLIGQLLRYMVLKVEDSDKVVIKKPYAIMIGNKWKVSVSSVFKYSNFSNAINAIFSQSEELGLIILSEKVSISYENTVELSRLKGEEIRWIAKAINETNPKTITISFIREQVKLCHIPERGIISRKVKRDLAETKSAGIRQMPKYDPDSEVNSLCMTIESWISSIQRVRNSGNFEKITEKASLQLMKKLSSLEYTVNSVQESLVERTSL